MKSFFLTVFTVAVLLFSNNTSAQENYGEYLNVIATGMPDVYVKSNNNLFFTIQVGAFRNKNEGLENVKHIVITKENDAIFRYRLGQFSTYKEASEFKKIILNVCNDAFIVPIKNGERIHIREALKETSAAI